MQDKPKKPTVCVKPLTEENREFLKTHGVEALCRRVNQQNQEEVRIQNQINKLLRRLQDLPKLGEWPN